MNNKYSVYLLLIIFSFLVNYNLKAQDIVRLPNIIIDGDYVGKNMHELLMDVNANGPIYIAYDVDQFKRIKMATSLSSQNLNELISETLKDNSYELAKQSERTYLLRYHNEIIIDQSTISHSNILISGTIKDKNGTPLSYAYVVSKDLKYGSYSDSLGRYKLKIPKTKHNIDLCAGNLGYENDCHNVNLSNDPQNFILREDPKVIEALTVIDMATPFRIRENAFTFKLLQRFDITSPGNDPLQKASLMPSVQSDDDLSAEIKIRNAQADETAIMYDNIPLFSNYHYNGFISNINPITVREISIYPCYTPPEYNNKSAGLVQILSLENKQKGISGTVGVNFLYATGMLQYRTDRHLFQIAGRSNISDISNQSFYAISQTNDNTTINPDGTVKELIPINPLYKFGDFNLKYQWKINNKWSVKLLHLQSRDITKSTVEFDFKPRIRKDTLFKRTQTEYEETHSIGSSISLNGKLNNSWDMNLSFVKSNLMYEDKASFNINKKSKKGPERTPTVFDIFNQVDWQEAKLKFDYTNDRIGTINLGYSLNNYMTEIKYQFDDHLITQNGYSKTEHHLFSSWTKRFFNKYELNIGTNLKLEKSTQPVHLSPRVSLSRKWNNGFKLSAEYGNYQQQLRKIRHENPHGKSFDFWTISRGDTIPSINSKQLDLGMEYKRSELLIRTNVFYRQSDGELSWIAQDPRRPKKINPNNPRPRPKYIYYKGKSKSYGFESMVYYQFKPFQALISYQLSKAFVSYPRIRKGEWQISENDRRHRLTGLLNYQFRRWTLEGSYSYISGKPYLDILKIPEGSNRNEKTFEDLYSQLPDYQRFDIGLNYYFEIGQKRIGLSFEVNNVFNHTNTDYRQFYSNDSDLSISGTSYNQMERYFNVGVEVKF